MQLLGIYLYKQTPRAVRKVLKPDWYPFGDYRKPATGKPVRFSDSYMQTAAYQVYQRERLPEITVNCIVGMNGAGKSTLLDILYMTINNMAVRLLGKKAQMTGRNLSYARGLYADFFFICENKQYRITCRDIQTKLYILDTKTGTFRLYSISNHSDANSVLSKLFYTISTNYSLYAFNQSEYFLEEDELLQPDEKHIDEINGEWISGLFHKNDGYCMAVQEDKKPERERVSMKEKLPEKKAEAEKKLAEEKKLNRKTEKKDKTK